MRKIALITYNHVQGFIRRPAWYVCVTVGLLGVLGIYWFVFSRIGGDIIIMGQTAYGQAVLTLTFMMMGIDLRREQRQEHLDDIIAAYPCLPWALPLTHIFTLVVMATAITTIIGVGCLIPLSLDGAPLLWLRKIALQIVLLYFLPCIILGTWGLVISHLVPGKGVYFPAILAWLGTSSLSIYFLGYITRHIDGWRLLSGFFSMGFNNFQMIPNLVTGPPIELPRWIVRGAIFILLVVIYLTAYSNNHASTQREILCARIKIGCVLACGVGVLCCLCIRYSVFFLRFANDDLTQHYTELAGWSYIAGKPTSLKNYPSEKYVTLQKIDIDFTCTSQGMLAEVTIRATMDQSSEGQSFTLFSGMTVDKVLVDGVAADYERSHDGIMVYFPSRKLAGEEVSFTFAYHGYTLPDYPVNETTVQLNQSFPWFPWPGIKTVSETEVSRYNMTQVFFLADWQQCDSVDYTLHYRGPGNLYTNLEPTGKGIFKGISSQGVALYSGMLHTSYRGVDSYVPASLYKYQTASIDAVLDSYALLKRYCQQMGALIIPSTPESVVTIQMKDPVWGYCTFFPNELFSRGSHWEIRIQGEDSAIIVNRLRAGSKEKYQDDLAVVSEVVVPYLVNPSSGYPTDAPSDATDCFADLMTLSIQVSDLDGETIKFYAERLYERYYEGSNIPSQWIDQILAQMQSGHDFTESLRTVYQQLLRSEPVTPEEIVRTLYADLEG